MLYNISELGLSDGENFAITIVEIVILTIMNTIMIVDLLNISIHNTKIKHGFLNTINYHSFRLLLYSFKKFLLVKLARIDFHTNSCEITIQMVRQSTITMVAVTIVSTITIIAQP